jgi:hypothetical protein
MIHYALQCSQAHEFDGWFASSAAFDAQCARGLVECPACGDVEVTRALMTPSVPRKGSAVVPASSSEQVQSNAPEHIPSQGAMAVTGEKLPDHLRAALQRLRAEVERNCDYVGPEFAEEARRIHTGEATPRGIYGETTPEQAEALAEDGIAIARIPWVPRADG